MHSQFKLLEIKTIKSGLGNSETAKEEWLWHQVNTEWDEDERVSGIGVKTGVPKANYVMEGLLKQNKQIINK